MTLREDIAVWKTGSGGGYGPVGMTDYVINNYYVMWQPFESEIFGNVDSLSLFILLKIIVNIVKALVVIEIFWCISDKSCIPTDSAPYEGINESGMNNIYEV
jgi:hypothetical protein